MGREARHAIVHRAIESDTTQVTQHRHVRLQM